MLQSHDQFPRKFEAASCAVRRNASHHAPCGVLGYGHAVCES
jgi:hypothetical protein